MTKKTTAWQNPALRLGTGFKSFLSRDWLQNNTVQQRGIRVHAGTPENQSQYHCHNCCKPRKICCISIYPMLDQTANMFTNMHQTVVNWASLAARVYSHHSHETTDQNKLKEPLYSTAALMGMIVNSEIVSPKPCGGKTIYFKSLLLFKYSRPKNSHGCCLNPRISAYNLPWKPSYIIANPKIWDISNLYVPIWHNKCV